MALQAIVGLCASQDFVALLHIAENSLTEACDYLDHNRMEAGS
jgi:hypothetical protein